MRHKKWIITIFLIIGIGLIMIPDPDDADPCNPDNTATACLSITDSDGDGVFADVDPDDADPCNPDDTISQCLAVTDSDEDGVLFNVDPVMCEECKIQGAFIDKNNLKAYDYNYLGDIWSPTLGPDGLLYMNWGDSTGEATTCVPVIPEIVPNPVENADGCIDPLFVSGNLQFCGFSNHPTRQNDCVNQCFTLEKNGLCELTPSGMKKFSGHPTNLKQVGDTLSVHIPYGDERVFEFWDKINTSMFVGNRLYVTNFNSDDKSSVNVNRGYISYSDNKGKTWTIVKNILFDGSSNFRVMSFIQNHHTDNPDGFVYILGQAKTLELLFTPMQIYLVRVDQNQITNPNAWEFFTGIEAGQPKWSPNEADSKPLDDLQTIAGGYSMYHKGLDRYLFFSPLESLEGINPLDISFYRAGLYESKTPYGDWKKVANMQAGFMSALIPAYFTNDEIWVTGSNYVGKNYETEDLYNLNVHKLILETPND